jgi:serine/threonine protein kinase
MNKRMPLASNTILKNRYRVIRKLGNGGMGVVYEAEDKENGESVALKETFADEEISRSAFIREARLLENLSHDAFPRVIDFFEEGEGYFLVMELIEGKDLDKLLKENPKPFEISDVLDWADQILDGLEYLHEKGIIHRDIKPSNLKLTPQGEIKLLDFGIAKGALGDMTTLHSGSIPAASLCFSPLEQVLQAEADYLQMLCVNFSDKTMKIHEQRTDARSDLYALAATLYQLLTKQRPVNSAIRASSLWSGQPDKLVPASQLNSELAPEFSDLLEKALSIERENRFGSASEMRKNLVEIFSAETYSLWALKWVNEQDYDRAIRYHNKAIQLKPSYLNYHYRGFCYAGKASYQLAITDFSKSMQLNPQFPNNYHKRGLVYFRQGNYEQALKDLTKAVELNPIYVGAYYNRGVIYHHLKDYDLAIKDFNKVIELKPYDYGIITFSDEAQIYKQSCEAAKKANPKLERATRLIYAAQDKSELKKPLKPVHKKASKRCPNCRREYSDSMRFCQTDGTPLVEIQSQKLEAQKEVFDWKKKCPNCGRKYPDSMRFCQTDGQPLIDIKDI